MTNNKIDFIFWTLVVVFIVLLIGAVCSVLVEQGEQGEQELEYRAVLKAKTGVFKFETESERCFVANKVGYAPSISCVKK